MPVVTERHALAPIQAARAGNIRAWVVGPAITSASSLRARAAELTFVSKQPDSSNHSQATRTHVMGAQQAPKHSWAPLN